MIKKSLLTFLLLGASLYATEPTRENVTKLYVATFERAPDSVGLSYWSGDGISSNGSVTALTSVEEIAQSFFDQTETQARYPEGTTTSVFVTSVYNNLFDRAPDSAGLDYWVNELDSGRIGKSVFILAVINGALDNDVAKDASRLANKTTVGLSFANAGLNDTNDASNILSTVTDDDTTVTSSLNGYGLNAYTGVFKAHPVRTQVEIDAADSTTLNGAITADTTLDKNTLYRVNGLVKVKNGATLTIPAGTVIFGTEGEDYIVVTKGCKIMAEGTADEPIIFTSQTALLNPSNAAVGQWGGLTVLGQATTNHTDPHYEVDESDPDFAFGGTIDNDNSGVLKNIYLLNSGETIGTDLEINGLSLAGVGSGTTVEDIYVENSSDDCIEVWGGTVNITNAVLRNCQDDSFDLDFGWSGTATNIVVQQTEAAHAGFEISSGGNTPMTNGKIVNFIINKADGSDEGGIYIKDDTTAPTFINGYVTTHGSDAALNAKKAMTTEQKATIAFKDVTLNNSTATYGGAGATEAQTRFEADDAQYASLKAHPVRTQVEIDAADSTTLNGAITADTTLDKNTLYRVNGLVKVKNGATLTIPAGTVIFGTEGEDYIVVTKGCKIMAEGTADEPIIFTSQTALLNPSNAAVGQWGGLTVLGQATTNHTDPHYEVDESDPDFAFGGTIDNDNSGVLKNIYLLNSGETIGTDLEINGLSLAGVGSGTTVEDIYVENSSDDCIEVWGGTVNITNAVLRNCQDDSFDLDFGWSGTATNIVVQQTEAAHAGFEISSGGNTPMTNGKIVNFIINKADGSDEGGIYIKDDTTAPTFINGYVTTHGSDAALNAKKAMTTEQKATIAFKDVTLNNSTATYGGAGATEAQTRFEADDADY